MICRALQLLSGSVSGPVCGPASQPVRLLLVVDSLQVGGGEQHAVDLAVTLHRQGYDVTVACSVGGSLSQVLEREGVEVRQLGHRLVKRRVSIVFGWRLRRLVRKSAIHLVHSHMYASAGAAAIATMPGVPHVHTEHSEAAWRSMCQRLVSRWIYRRTVHVIAVSHSIHRRLTEQDRVPRCCVTVIPSAVTITSADPPPEVPSELCGRPLVGVIARLQREKGVAIFLDAVAHIAARVPTCHFLIVGDGPLRTELMNRTRHLRLDDCVHFLGFRPDARALLPLLDVLVVPSLSEGSPLVVLEAMAAAVPVVASAVGGIPDQIRHSQEGLLVPPGKSRALGEALLSLLQDPARARCMGQAGRRRVATTYRHATMVQRVVEIYGATLRAAMRAPLQDGREPRYHRVSSQVR